MASTRTKTQPVGSSGWIQNERDQSAQFVDQEVEEFGYSVRNELEWLNEHMGDIFARNNVTLADVFKTPGKLRGKTPRTARKRDALGTRQPLTDIFAPNMPAPPSAQKSAFLDKVHQFQIADDAENQPPATRPISRGKSPQRVGKPGNTDSGYHGMTEDEMDVDQRTETATDTSSQQSVVQKVPLRDNQGPAQRVPETVVEARDGDTSGDSFMSAKEDLTSRNASKEQLSEEEMEYEMEVDEIVRDDDVEMGQQDQGKQPAAEAEVFAEDQDHDLIQDQDQDRDQDQDQDQDQDMESSASETSSPEKPLQRKSSFTFTALPPRDPMKRSIGARNSQIDTANARTSTLARSFGAKSVGLAQDDEDEYSQEKPEESKAHSKTSTQLLHERINMLGKTKEPRPSKSIAQAALNAQPAYPQLPAASESRSTAPPVDDDEDEDDDWIAPTKPAQPKAAELSSARPPMHQKSISTTAIPSPRPNPDQDARQQKAISVSNPNYAYALGEIQSTTPAGSPPAKKYHDGPLSASKNRLYSVLKSAKSIFASSASASAAAKLEAHNTPSKSPRREPSNDSKIAAVLNMPGAMYSQQQFADPPRSPTRSMISLVSKSPSRKTRSSSESDKKREKELKTQQKAAEKLEQEREKERQKAAKQQEKEKAKAQKNEPAKIDKELPRPPTAESEQDREPEQPGLAQQKQQPKSLLPGGKLRAPGRLAKPTRAESAQPSRPGVSIRVPSQSQRLGQGPSASTLSKSQHETNAQGRPPTAGSIRSGSAQAGARSSTAPPNAHVKAIQTAQRKKEADERAAQKKLEQKRQRERERAAKAEEERKIAEEKKAAEQARIQEAKLAAQRQAEKQALEQRRKEEARQDAQRRQEEEKRARAAHDLAEAIKRERAQEAQKPSRGDVGGTLRQLAAKHTVPEHGQGRAPQMNHAKPAKRIWDPADDEPAQQHPQPPQRPGMQRGPPSYQQHDAKRRRTNEEEPPMQPARSSVMAPPMRPSAMRKESTLQKFPHGYTHAPPAAPHSAHGHGPSMFKATVTAQHQLQHPGPKGALANHPSQMVQVSNARIPFAENANGQAAQHYHHTQAGGHENMHPGQQSAGHNKYKTPARPAHAPKSAKSSPLYPNGDNIQLPDIATDSEDEDSEDEDDTGAFRAPSWVASPALRDLLTQQQLVDPETVFGPIGELKMDEVFKGAKNQERLKRFRDRGSSAAWIESGDAVTSAEKRRDMAMREQVVRDGGWRYEPTH